MSSCGCALSRWIDPAMLFDPTMLTTEEERGFRILYPDWDKTKLFDKPTFSKIKSLLQNVDLSAISDEAVKLSQIHTLSVPPLNNSSEQKIAAVTPALVTPFGTCSVSVIEEVAEYLKGKVVSVPYNHFGYLEDGILNTKLRDLRFFHKENGIETLQRCIKTLRSGSFEDCINAIFLVEETIGIRGTVTPRDFFGYTDFVLLFGVTVKALRNGKRHENETCIAAIEKWISGDIQRIAISCLFATRLFDYYSKNLLVNFKNRALANQTIKEEIVDLIYGATIHTDAKFPHNCVTLQELLDKNYTFDITERIAFRVYDDRITLGKLSYSQMRVAANLYSFHSAKAGQLTDLFFIYSRLTATTQSMKLAFDLGILDCDNYSTAEFLLRSPLSKQRDINSRAGEEYAKLSTKFYSWRFRILRDFSNSFTKDAFSVLVTITAIVISLTGVIQVVQGFLS